MEGEQKTLNQLIADQAFLVGVCGSKPRVDRIHHRLRQVLLKARLIRKGIARQVGAVTRGGADDLGKTPAGLSGD